MRVPTTQVTGQAGMSSHEAQVGGIRMRWVERGEGLPVVLIHGIPTSPALWRRVMPRVEGARLLAWEMVGFGHSIAEGAGRDISVRAQAGYLLQWLDSQGLDRVVLAGHDLGGGVVQIAAVRNPERCLGLLLTNAICYDSWPVPSVKALRATSGVVRHLPDPAIKTGVFGMLMARGHDDDEVARESLELHWSPYAQAGAAEALVRQVEALDVEDTLSISSELPRLRGMPARVVWGMDDPLQKPHYGLRLSSDLDVSMQRIDGGKHFTPEDHPEAIAAALDSLVREVEEQLRQR
ncbi:MAG: alpha/beta fold hydrolase [Pseudomonadota bacterium]|nr:alpha/beta fold hydrolase [Pseudomonadota bacterium]